ncbi:zinc finger and SCAN domain-containing 9 [Labeo rohita]|uniref:Zinc finger and SCAN domain-containing 9 n=1 Tax=Labeo rohita TaxID=84645 RepID=A0A498MRP9_LABRO|nr:zinc finger and SCAN domain-containing 9 [Labeo rohita]
MAGKAPQRVTRAHPVLFSEGEDTVEAVETVNTGETELDAVGREVDSSLDHFPLAVNSQEEDTEPVVRTKTVKVSTPHGKEGSVGLEQDFFNEMRQFMQQQQRKEKILFEELHHLKASILPKPRSEWEFEDQASQHTHRPLPSPRTFLQPPPAPTAYPAQTAHSVHPDDGMQVNSQVQNLSFRRYHEPRIPEFVEGEDVESFFVRFERIARTWGWPMDEWAARVVTLLTGKALEAYAGMEELRAGNYSDIKAAVLAKYNVTEETYRLRFRSLMVPSGETVRETYNRIKGLYRRWMRPETKTKDQMGETIILEQYLRMLRPEVRVWVKENQPQTGEEAARLAERYVAAHQEPSRTIKDRIVKNENQVAMMVQAVDEEVDEEEMKPIRHSEDIPGDYSHLSDQQQQQLVKKPYRVPEKMVEKLKTEVKMMLEMGIVEPSQSEWSSPILLVPKKDGGVRFCTDFRKLNSVSCFDSYPMPRIDELIERLDLTKKSPSKFHWTRECQEAFEALKQLLCQEPILQSPDFSKRFLVQVDASDVGLGAVLAQGELGSEQPVLFLSRKLFERERRYSTVEKEGLAIKWAVDSLRYYLLGREFTLQTDHRALKWMHSMQNNNSRILRWCLALQPYKFTIEHCPGESNVLFVGAVSVFFQGERTVPQVNLIPSALDFVQPHNTFTSTKD